MWTLKVKENFDEWEQRGAGKHLLCVITRFLLIGKDEGMRRSAKAQGNESN